MKIDKSLYKQIIKFGLIGFLATLVDLSAYFILLKVIPEDLFVELSNESISKTISFLCGLFVTFYINKHWTWKQKEKSRKRFMKFLSLYGMALLLNVSLNELFLHVLHHYDIWSFVPHKYFFAFVAATGFTACFNFVGQKFWVFKASV
jgi:putative flippase GtrA